MKVAITGATGFVGSFVLRSILQDQKHEVAVLGRNRETAWRIDDVMDKAQWIQADLDDAETYSKALHAFVPDAVIHLAWSGVGSADRNSPQQFQSLSSSLNLLEAAISAGCKHWVGLGSQAEYGRCRNRVTENQATQPTTLYGQSKLSAGQLMAMRCKQVDVRFAWMRLFSSFGPTDNPEWMIPYLIRQLSRKERPALTLGEQLWDYIYVEDAANAVYSVLNSPEASGVFNLGSGKTIQLRRFVEKIRDRIDPSLPLGFGEVAYREDQVMHLEADNSRLIELTGWEPVTPLDTAIANTVAWYTRPRS
jgi:UDP-glucose 4-epimerase